MEKLNIFYRKIPNAKDLKPSGMIPYLSYYLETENIAVTSNNIDNCFKELSIPSYSGISTYLARQSDKKIGKYIKQKNGYKLTRHFKEEIAGMLNEVMNIPLTNHLIDICILNNTQSYLTNNAIQMCKCYDTGLYDASLVLMRKLMETLIIESFERYGIEDDIKRDGNYRFLSELIPAYITSKKWTASRNIKTSLEKIKKYGDASAHNRRFIATKKELDDVKFELGQAIQEIILLIDYPNWVLDKKTK